MGFGNMPTINAAMARSRFALPRGCRNIVIAVGASAFRQLLSVTPATVESAELSSVADFVIGWQSNT